MVARHYSYLLLAGALAWGSLVQGAEEPVRLTADQVSYDQGLDVLQAEGNVTALWGGATLTAKRIDYLRAENRLRAVGAVNLNRDGDWFRGEQAEFDTLSQRATIEQPHVFLKRPNIYVAGARLERSSDIDYLVQGGSITTCDGETPSWRIDASEVSVTMEEYASARNALFYVAKVPIFYFPYLIFPIKTERQSGLLLPNIGSSTKKGFFYTQPYYWVISPSADATLELDLQTKRGVGGGGEFRYLRPRQSSGQFDGYAIYDQEQQRMRGNLHFAQREELPAGFTLRSDVTQVTDRNYYRDFTVESGDYNRQYLESAAVVGWQGERSLLDLAARSWRNLDPASTDVALQRLPVANGRLVSSQFGMLPVSMGLSASAVRFDRETGVQGERAELTPSLLLALPVSTGVTLSVGGGYQLRGYLPERSLDGERSRGIGIASAEAGLETALERNYGTGWASVPNLKHLLFPKVGYHYVQMRNQEQLPFFDWDDRVLGRQEVTWSLANVIQGTVPWAEVREWRDLLSLRMSQGVVLEGARRELLAPVDSGDRVGDLRLEMLAAPVKELSIRLDSRYNPNRSILSSMFLSADYRDLRNNLASIGYYEAHHQFSYLEGRLATSLFRPVLAEYRGRYSPDRHGFLESFYSLEYRHQCWGVTLSYRDRPDNREVMVSFSLGGIGSLGKLKVF